MSNAFKKYLSCLLALSTILSILQPSPAQASETGIDRVTQQLWLTEIYANDIARNDLYTGLSGPTIDSMDYIEVYNASDSEQDFGATFNLVYTDASDKILTFNEAELKIPAHSAAVFWVRRVDLENNGKTMPDEAAFRASHNIPAEVPVFSVNNQTALKNTSATISIAAKSNNEKISTYTYDTSDVGSAEGTSVHLQAEEGNAHSRSLAKQAAPSAGQVNEVQQTLLTKLMLTPGAVSRLSEVNASVSFASNRAGHYYYAVVSEGEGASIIDTNGSGTAISGNVETLIELTALTSGAKDLYVVVKDDANNVSDPLKLVIPEFVSNTSVYLTEIYPNDIARNLVYTGLSGATIDSMDYIEVYNASSAQLDFGRNFNLIYKETGDKALTFNETEITIPARSAAVFWVRRTDLENKGKTMPDEAAFRLSNNIPAEVPVFSVNNQTALKNTTAAISISTKSSNEIISSYTYDLSDAGALEGTSVHLQAVEGNPGAIAIAKQAPSSAGQVSEVQKERFSKAILTARAVNRSSVTNASAAFTSNKAASYYYAVVEDGATAPLVDTTGSGIPVNANEETLIELTALTAGAKDVYLVVKDAGNQVSDTLKFDLPDYQSDVSLYLTEIYPNDIPRQDVYTGLSSDTVDSMDYIEVYNASADKLDFGTYFNLVYKDLSVTPIVNKTLTFNETELQIPAHSAAVFWVRRVDLENKGKTMPGEADFRKALSVPEDVPVFSVNNQTALKNTTAQISIVAKGSNEVISTYSYITTDAGTAEGTSVHLQAAEGIANTLAIAKQAAPTAGQVSDIQTTPKADPGVVPEISLLDNSGKYDLIEEGKDLSIPYSYKDPTGIQSFTVYYRTNQSKDWTAQESNSFNTRTPDKFYVEIGADRFLNSEYIEYYVEAKNTFRTATTPVHRVNVIRPNAFTDIRANVTENETLSGRVKLIGRSQDNANVDIKIDGTPMNTTRVLEHGAYFTLDINGLDGRKNAIVANGNLVQVFSRWYDVLPSRAVKIDSSLFTYHQNGDAEVTVQILAGTEIDAMDITPGTASDNFNITNFALVLPDGTRVLPDGAVKSSDPVTMNSTKREVELHFTVPKESVTANGVAWDTASAADGAHTIFIQTANDSKEIHVNVDNTGPVIRANSPSHIDGAYTFSAEFLDASAVVSDTLVLELDGSLLDGVTFNGSELTPGKHKLKASVQDEWGNTGTAEWTFESSVNFPVFSKVASPEGKDDAATLTAALSAGDRVTVSFHEAQALTVGKGITVYQGTGDDTAGAVSGALGAVTSKDGSLPYQMYAFDVAEPDSTLRISLDAAADYGKDVRLYVSNKAADQWILLDSSYEAGKVNAVLTADDYIRDGKVYVLAQGRGMEMSPGQTAGRTRTTDNDYVWDGTGEPEQYDFSIAWESDTQYYSERFPGNFEMMNSHIAANKDRLDTRYVVHTGDLVDDLDETYEWDYADQYMKILEDAGIPYGVLAGNHDIANHNGRYQNYQTYFGTDRFKNNGVYGGSYNNNLGHYDLVTAGGQDFIFVYMSYDFDKNAVEWMNKVLAEHSDRMAILALHNYVNASAELDTAGNYFQQEVVAKNPNLKLVLGGHYHGAAINVSGFDDDGDGKKERRVYQILTDYQSGEEGGNAYYKNLFFDLARGKVYMNAFSPKLVDYNYYDAAKLASYETGVQAAAQDIYELDLDFDLEPKTLTVGSIDAVLYGNTALNTAAVKKGSAAITVEGLSDLTHDSWLAIAKNDSGIAYSELAAFRKSDGAADTAAPKLTAGKVIRSGNSTATVTFSADEAGSYYYGVVNRDAGAPSLNTAGNGVAYQANTEVRIALADLNAGDKSIYIVAKDKAGNKSNVLKMDIPAYSEPSSGDHNNTDPGSNTGSGSNAGPSGSASNASSIESSTAGNVNTIRLQLAASGSSQDRVTGSIDSSAVTELLNAVKEAGSAGRTVVVDIQLNASAAAEVTLPKALIDLLAQQTNAQLRVNAGIGIVTLDEGAMDAIIASSTKENNVGIHIVKEASAGLSGSLNSQMDRRPMYNISVLAGNTIITDLGEGKALVRIPYTLLPGEEQDAIVIYRLSGKGGFEPVRGKFNPDTEAVEWNTAHLSSFVIGHNKVTFNDVASTAWYYDAITFNAARGVTLGTGNGEFSPDASLTRGQFLVMLMRAYGLQASDTLTPNFSDAGNKYYTNYLAAAKNLGITTGVGDNKFAPDSEITRQDMFTMIYRVLGALHQLPEQTGNSTAKDYSDGDQVSDYAYEAVNALIQAEIIHGNNGKLSLTHATTRAELAQILYNLPQ